MTFTVLVSYCGTRAAREMAEEIAKGARKTGASAEVCALVPGKSVQNYDMVFLGCGHSLFFMDGGFIKCIDSIDLSRKRAVVFCSGGFNARSLAKSAASLVHRKRGIVVGSLFLSQTGLLSFLGLGEPFQLFRAEALGEKTCNLGQHRETSHRGEKARIKNYRKQAAPR